jgi:hypothetical protein
MPIHALPGFPALLKHLIGRPLIIFSSSLAFLLRRFKPVTYQINWSRPIFSHAQLHIDVTRRPLDSMYVSQLAVWNGRIVSAIGRIAIAK